MLQDNEINQVEKLLERVVDSRDGYADAHEQTTKSGGNKEFIGELAGQRQDYAKTIKETLEQNGRNIDLEGSFLANTHRLFMDIREKMDGDEEELFEEIIRGEKQLLSDYDDTLQTVTSNDNFKNELQKQRDQVAANLDLIKAKEEAA